MWPHRPDAVRAVERLPLLAELVRDPEQAASLPWDTAALLLVQCGTLQSLLAARLLHAPRGPEPRRSEASPAAAGSPEGGVDSGEPREYLSIRELAERIPYSVGTLRNLISQGRLRLGEHYVKPEGRVMFKWTAIRDWLERGPGRRT